MMANEVITLWTVQDIMRVLGVKKSWVYERTASGELPHIRLGAYIRFDPEDVRRYIQSKKNKPATLLHLKRDNDE